MIVDKAVASKLRKLTARGERANVVLDLDNTLICSVKYTPDAIENPLYYKYHVMDKDFIVYERPGIHQFLDFLFEHANVYVWSAGTKDYVTFIVENVIQRPHRHVGLVLHRDHCDMSIAFNSREGPKDLNFLWDTARIPGLCPHNTVIIDDLDLVKRVNPSSCIHIPEFDVEDTDTHYSDIAIPVLHSELAGLI